MIPFIKHSRNDIIELKYRSMAARASCVCGGVTLQEVQEVDLYGDRTGLRLTAVVPTYTYTRDKMAENNAHCIDTHLLLSILYCKFCKM